MNTIKVMIHFTLEVDADRYESDYDITRGQVRKDVARRVELLLADNFEPEGIKVTGMF